MCATTKTKTFSNDTTPRRVDSASQSSLSYHSTQQTASESEDQEIYYGTNDEQNADKG